jgi:predicted ATPase/DNA-binding winged helix-turn-helix (wHTH) protein
VTYRFGDIEVDVAAFEARRDGRRIPLTRQPMEVLLLLLERRGELVTREDIATRLWAPDVFTDVDAGIRTAILKIRQGLQDSREPPRFVETVAGKGYRFVASVDVVPHAPPGSGSNPEGPRDSGHNLPAELTSFVGRQAELVKLSDAIRSTRLLTLTGSGGVGKTRLAMRLASTLVHDFPGGVWWVDLAPLLAPDLVTQTVATVLGIREGPQRSAREAVLDTLRHRALLLVLDNCEHLIAACAELADALLREAPALRMLTTSREALHVSGEVVFRVPSLSLPVVVASVPALGDAEATQLFIERASALDAAFAPTPVNAGVIARICQRLDGIPLAIELAAARTVVLSPEQIEARLQDRFRLLTDGARSAVARHRTLEATVDWSYELLSDPERELFGRLSVFPGGWTLEAAEHVCGGDGVILTDVLDLVSRLVNKSLVVVDKESVGEHRYRFLETVRQYAREHVVRADAAERLRQRHLEFVFEAFREAGPILRGHGQLPLLRRLRIEQENVRAALDWALSSEAFVEQGVELAGALFWFWVKRGQFEEGRRWLERALTVGSASGWRRARVCAGLANIDYFQGVDATAHLAEAVSLGREAHDAWVVAHALAIQGLVALERGDQEAATARAVEAREAASAGGGTLEHSLPLFVLGCVAALNGDHDRAQQLYDESIEASRSAGDTWSLGILLLAAAATRVVRSDCEQARAQASEALSLFQEIEDPRGIAWSLEVCAGLMAAADHADSAARLWGASAGQRERIGASLPPNLRLVRDLYADAVKTSLGEARFEAVREDGRAMALVDAIALARQHALVHR